MNSLDQTEFLMKLEKAKAYIRLGLKKEAEVEYIKALDISIGIAKQDSYEDAVRLLVRLMSRLEEGRFLESAWAETYSMIAVCYTRLNDRGNAQKFFDKACKLEPENDDLKEIAIKNGYSWC